MSVADMAQMMRAFNGDAIEQAQNYMKNNLQIENGINKNWQDALTFNQNVEQINTANLEKTRQNEQAYNKGKQQENLMSWQAAYAFDPKTGRFRSPFEVARILGENRLDLGVYGGLENWKNAQTAAQTQSQYLAGLDPVAAVNVAQQGGMYGGANITAAQGKDGQVAIANSQGFTDTMSPHIAGSMIADPTKTRATQATWDRQDFVDNRNFNQQLAANDHSTNNAIKAAAARQQLEINGIVPKAAATAAAYDKYPQLAGGGKGNQTAGGEQLYDTKDISKAALDIYTEGNKNGNKMSPQEANLLAFQLVTGGQPAQTPNADMSGVFGGVPLPTKAGVAAPVNGVPRYLNPQSAVTPTVPLYNYFNGWRTGGQ